MARSYIEKGPEAGFWEFGDKTLAFLKGEGYLDYICDYQLLKKFVLVSQEDIRVSVHQVYY